GCHRKNRQSNRQKPEITRQAHQSTVLRSLQIHGCHRVGQTVLQQTRTRNRHVFCIRFRSGTGIRSLLHNF
ncbi:hypothetical protein FOH24_17005, partial [Acetobacter tropicalis]